MELRKISSRAPEKLDKETIKVELPAIYKELDELQNLLYADHKHSILVIIQGMDASGKDGLIKSVCAGLNPQGVLVKSFKVPTAEEQSHDFLWRIHQHTPPRGMIHVFNRSQYEAVITTRVHKMITDKKAKQLFRMLNDFEYLLREDGRTHVLKCYMHVSPERQAERIADRLKDPSKMWKYNPEDLKEASLYNEHLKYYEEMIANCNEVPWLIVPADQNWYKSYFVATALRDLLRGLKMEYPVIQIQAEEK